MSRVLFAACCNTANCCSAELIARGLCPLLTLSHGVEQVGHVRGEDTSRGHSPCACTPDADVLLACAMSLDCTTMCLQVCLPVSQILKVLSDGDQTIISTWVSRLEERHVRNAPCPCEALMRS